MLLPGPTVAALYVESDGCYSGMPGVDPWDIHRDASTYDGPHPVVCHPPCQRWGRFWHGSTRKPHQFAMGDDGGCFEAALSSVRRWSGVLEHPADSHAWKAFGLSAPSRIGGWKRSDDLGGWSCYVEQGHYGHMNRKGTWLYANGIDLPELRWGSSPQRIHPVALERHGYEKARRIGMMAMMGGKRKTEIRNATPAEFRDVLLSMARSAASAARVLDVDHGGRQNVVMDGTRDDSTKVTAQDALIPSDELSALNMSFGERMCRVGSPGGPTATIQRIFRRRGAMPGVYAAKVIMFDDGATAYVDWGDVHPS